VDEVKLEPETPAPDQNVSGKRGLKRLLQQCKTHVRSQELKNILRNYWKINRWLQ